MCEFHWSNFCVLEWLRKSAPQDTVEQRITRVNEAQKHDSPKAPLRIHKQSQLSLWNVLRLQQSSLLDREIKSCTPSWASMKNPAKRDETKKWATPRAPKLLLLRTWLSSSLNFWSTGSTSRRSWTSSSKSVTTTSTLTPSGKKRKRRSKNLWDQAWTHSWTFSQFLR